MRILKWLMLIIIVLMISGLGTLIYSARSSHQDELTTILPSYDGKLVIQNIHIASKQSPKLVNIYLSDGKIERITDTDESIDSNYQLVEGHGHYIMPALIDSHAHIFEPSALTRYLSHGVTYIRNMQGMPIHLRLKQALREGTLTGAELITATPTLNGNSHSGPFHKIMNRPEELAPAIRYYKKQGYDFIKVYDGLSKPVALEIFKLAETAGLKVSGHLVKTLSVPEQASRMASIEHIEELFQTGLDFKYTKERSIKLAKQLLESKTMVTTTIVAFQHIYQVGKDREIDEEIMPVNSMNPLTRTIGEKGMQDWIQAENNDWMGRKYLGMELILNDLVEVGVPLALATDAGPALTIPGYSVYEEIKLLSEAGLSNEVIIEAATVNNAKLLGIEDKLGQVKPGFQADLLITINNPFDHLSTLKSPYSVIKEGQVFEGKSLLALKMAGLKHQSFMKTLGVLIDHWWNL